MGLFSNLINGNSKQEVVRLDAPTTSSYVREGSSTSTASVNIDEDTALKIGALHQGINIIGDTLSAMPVYLYKDTDGFDQIFLQDSRSRVMSNMANEVLSSFNLKKVLIKDLILHGNAYAKIVREGKNVKLYYLPVDVVTPKKDNNGYYYEIQSYSTDVNGENYQQEIIDDADMLVLVKNNKYNSVTGTGLLDYAKDVLGISVEESDYMLNLFRNGLSAKALLTSKTPFKREIKEQLKSDLRDFYQGSQNAGKMLVLEGDISVTPLSLTPTDIRLIENKQFTISEISRFLNIQKHLLNLDRSQGVYSNITSERMMLLQNTLSPYVTMIESALNSKLLTPQEIEQGYYFSFDTSEMLRLTPEDQANYMTNLYKEGICNLEEVRSVLGLGGDAETIAELKELQKAKYYSTISQYMSTGSDADATTTEDSNSSETQSEKEEKEDEDIDKKSSKEVQKKNE